MPENIRCRNCDRVVYGITSVELRPVEGEECPDCGGTEFERIK